MSSNRITPSPAAILRATVLLTLLYSLLLGGVVSALAQSQDEYVVKQGDTLLRISQSQNTTVDELLQANRLSRTTILSVGQVLKIPRAEPPVTEATAAAPEPAPVAEIPAPANVAASIESVPPEAPISVPAAEPAAAPLGGAPAAVNLPAGANAPTAASSASGVSLPVSSNTSPSTTSPPSPFSLPSVPELLAVLLLLTLGTWLIIEMRRARPRLPGRGPRDSGPNS